MAVVGFNYPTLSEYVVHKVNGFLLEEKKGNAISSVDWMELGKAARESVEFGYQAYLSGLVLLKDQLLAYEKNRSATPVSVSFVCCLMGKALRDFASLSKRMVLFIVRRLLVRRS